MKTRKIDNQVKKEIWNTSWHMGISNIESQIDFSIILDNRRNQFDKLGKIAHVLNQMCEKIDNLK